MQIKESKLGLWQKELFIQAAIDSLKKLDPRTLWRNPVMFIVEIGSVMTTLIAIHDYFNGGDFWFDIHISFWLWATVLFANFAEAVAEGRGKGHADALRRTRSDANANRLLPNGQTETVPALSLRKDDLVIIKNGEPVPGDGDIIKGVALVDESAITGESAPVVREAGGDRSAVTGGTKVITGQITVRIMTDPGNTFLDHMIGMVESAKRQKTPNERSLEILLIAMTLAFLVVVGMMIPFANYLGVTLTIPVLVSLLVCLIPTTIGGLLPAIGIAGMDRLLQFNVIAMSGRAIEASGDVGVVLLDKTGTITLGNRMASEFIPAEGVKEEEIVEASLLASLADETPEGRSIVALAKERLGVRGRDIHLPEGSSFVPFSAQTRMSGIKSGTREIYKGSADSIEKFVTSKGQTISDMVRNVVDDVASEGCTPLIVTEGLKILGVIRLKDILKQGINERVAVLRMMGISSVMITGDNTLTAVSIAAEAGLDDFFAQANPETKLDLIRKYQKQGHLVAMIGDGVNDAPALAQADVGVAMNAGTQAAREAANMLDLDSNPTKLLDIVEIGKKILITRGALTTFSVTNDVAKYFAIIPAMLMQKYPQLGILNIMHLSTAKSAVLSAVIFNAIIIPSLIPLALRGVLYRPTTAAALLRRNLLIYGLGGLLLPFVGIKLIDWVIVLLKLG